MTKESEVLVGQTHIAMSWVRFGIVIVGVVAAAIVATRKMDEIEHRISDDERYRMLEPFFLTNHGKVLGDKDIGEAMREVKEAAELMRATIAQPLLFQDCRTVGRVTSCRLFHRAGE